MTFLSPNILWALFAAGIPIIIHLISMRNTREVEYSTLRFIQELEHETIRNLKIRQWLLILLRVLAIIFLVLMFARPVQQGISSTIDAEDKESIVVLFLDNSASMAAEVDGVSLLESAKQSIPAMLDVFEGKTKVEIYQTNPVKQVFRGDLQSKAIREALNMVSQSMTSDKVFSVVDSVLSSIENTDPNKECFIVSDFSKPINTPELDRLELKNSQWRFYCLEQLKPKDNLSLRDVHAVSQIRLPNHVLKLNTRIANDGYTERKNQSVELFLNQERLGQVVSTFQPEKIKEFMFQAYPGQAGIVHGKIELPADDYPMDNQWHFELPIPEQIVVTIIGETKEDIFLIETALSSIDNQSGFLVLNTQTSPSINQLYLDESDVLILHNPGKISKRAVEDIQIFLRQGGGIIWFAGNNQADYSGNINENAIGIPETVKLHSVQNDAYYFILPETDNHPILSDLNLRDIQRELPQVYQYVETKKASNEKIILKFGNSDSFLSELNISNGVIYYFTSLVDLNWNDLPVRGLLVPLLHRILLLLATDEFNTKSVIAGESKFIQLDRELMNNQWSLETPSGKTILLIPDFNRESLSIPYTNELGSFKVFADGLLYTSFSTQLSPKEYASNRMTNAEVLNILPSENTRWIEPEIDLVKELNTIRYGKSLWRYFLILAIIILILESLIGRVKPEQVKQT